MFEASSWQFVKKYFHWKHGNKLWYSTASPCKFTFWRIWGIWYPCFFYTGGSDAILNWTDVPWTMKVLMKAAWVFVTGSCFIRSCRKYFHERFQNFYWCKKVKNLYSWGSFDNWGMPLQEYALIWFYLNTIECDFIIAALLLYFRSFFCNYFMVTTSDI